MNGIFEIKYITNPSTITDTVDIIKYVVDCRTATKYIINICNKYCNFKMEYSNKIGI
jgi:hypothetical protein